MRWFKTEIVENTLNEHQVQFTYQTVDFKKIDLKKSRNNNARICGQPINDDVVFAYAEDMARENAAYPATVLRQIGKAFIAIDGNHRLNAFDASEVEDKQQIEAYVVHCDDDAVIEILTRFFNRTNGFGQSNSEAIQHCIYLLETYPTYSQRVVADKFGIKEATLSREIRAKKTRETLAKNGIKTNGASTGVLASLASLKNSEPVMVKAGALISSHGYKVEDADALVKRIKKCTSEADMLNVVREEEMERGRRNAKPVMVAAKKLRKRDAILRQLRNLSTLLGDKPTRESMEITSASDYAQAEGLASDVTEKLGRLFK